MMNFFGRQQPILTQQQDDFFMPLSRRFMEPNIRRQKPILDDQDYYDPLFGTYSRKKQTCNCMDCQMERYFQRRNQQQGNGRYRESVRESNNEREKHQRRKQYNKEDEPSSLQEYNQEEIVNQTLEKVENSNIEQQDHDFPGAKEEEEENEIEGEESIDEVESEESYNYESEGNKTESKEIYDKKNISNSDKQSEDESKRRNIEAKIQIIEIIKDEVNELNKKVQAISTNVKDYNYRYCEEMLVKCLLKLDDILADGEEVVRTTRKNVIEEINKTLYCLEEKLK